MTELNTTKQLYKLMSSQHRMMLGAVGQVRSQSLELDVTLWRKVAAEQEKTRRLVRSSFSICAGLIVGVAGLVLMQQKRLQDTNELIKKDKHYYIITENKQGKNRRMEVWEADEVTPGDPTKPEKKCDFSILVCP